MQDRDGGDFASAAMMRLVAEGLARQGIGPVPRPPRGAHVPRTDKREVLERVLAAHGPLAVLSIADAARHMAPEPVLRALTMARDTPDLLERWRRLERFSHSRHVVEVAPQAGGPLRLTHRARDGGSPPSVAESLIVVGVLAILAEMVTGAPVRLTSPEGEVWREGGIWTVPSAVGPPLCALLTALPARVPLAMPAADARDPVAGLRQRILRDPVRRWTVAALAAEAGTTPRSLQRRLAGQATSVSRLVAETRLEAAAALLCARDGPGLAKIAFLAGFADQAHLTRSFRRAVGTTPRSYRADFARRPGLPLDDEADPPPPSPGPARRGAVAQNGPAIRVGAMPSRAASTA
jgi:AraC-like DNA-binding protein